MTRLIRAGHPPHVAWQYTPKQLLAFNELLQRDEAKDAALMVRLLRASKAPNKTFREFVKKLDKQVD